jgi:hypothetical protein
MDFFRVANNEDVKRIITPGGEGFLDLKGEFSKGEVNKIIINAPKDTTDVAGSLSFIERFAEIAILDWSFKDKEGKPVKFSLKVYRELAAPVAKWLDAQLGEHLQSTIGKDVEEVEGKPED